MLFRSDTFLSEGKFDVPSIYRDYLLKTNGGNPSKSWFYIPDLDSWSKIHHMYGFHDGPNYRRLDFAQTYNQIGGDYLLFGDDPQGSQIAIMLSPNDYGSIWYWDHNSGKMSRISGSFEDFINSLEDKNPQADSSVLDQILDEDDVDGILEFIGLNGIDYMDDMGRSLIENSAIQNSLGIAKYLISKNVDLGNALAFARKNEKFFPEFKELVMLLEESV